ncbi:MAG: PQQ-like beta-propeller repeat protein [Phycisphaerae bacterium]|nr:PQQ-like beta-propeller repeat protein [Phycisphaerae bacterium]
MKPVRQPQKTVIVIVFFCLMSGVFAASKKPLLREPLVTALVPHALIRQAGWTYSWQINLPVKTNEQIDRVFLHDQYLYALTDTNILFCIDRQEGKTLYAVTLCQKDLPLCSPIFYEGRLGFIAGNQIHVFDPSNGIVQEAEAIEQVGNIFECGVSRNTDFIYITGSDKRLHAISPDGYWQAFTATADNDSAISSVIATDSVVVFATQAGNVVGIKPDAPKKLWQYDISGPIRANIVTDGKSIYTAGMDAKLYKLNIQTGTLAWDIPFHAGAPVLDPAVIGNDVIYLYNDLNGLYAVNKNDGKAVWNVADGKNTLCESGEKAFVYARPGILKVMDNKTGKELYSVNFSEVQRYAENMTDSVLYVADEGGRLMSITVE